MKRVITKFNCICEGCGKTFLSRSKDKKICRPCVKKKCDKKYDLSHQKEFKAYRLKNKEKIKRQRAEHYQKNIEKERQNCKIWYSTHKESEMIKNKEYREQNKELFNWYHDKDRFGGVKSTILERDKNKCRICGSQKRISVHHKDGSGDHAKTKGNIVNNDFSNLITLCSSCHSRLHRWQERNNTILIQDEDIVRTVRKLIEVDVNNPR